MPDRRAERGLPDVQKQYSGDGDHRHAHPNKDDPIQHRAQPVIRLVGAPAPIKDDLAGDDRLAPADDQAQADQRQAAVQQDGDAEPVAADHQQNAHGDQCDLYPRDFCHIATLPIGSDSAPKSRVGRA